MNIATLAEISKSQDIELIPLPKYAHVWMYLLWEPNYTKYLDFMSTTDTDYPTDSYSIGNVIINYIPLYLAPTLNDCIVDDQTYYINGNELYIHFQNNEAPYAFISKKTGVVYGFTNKNVIRLNGVTYLPEIQESPPIEEGIDPLEYNKMAFNSGSLVIANGNRTFDSLFDVFGNECNIKMYDYDTTEITNIHRFFVENYSTSMQKASFTLKDTRSLLSRMIPTAQYTSTAYPYIKDDMIGEPVQDAFGTLYGVPGVCLNETEGNVAKVFRFGSFITSLSSVQVYRNEQWETAAPASTDYANGTITLSVANSHDAGDYTKGVLKCKATGVFRSETNPADIIIALITENTNIPLNDEYFNTAEIEAEKTELADVGLFVRDTAQVYDYIEKLQGGSDIGFQLLSRFGQFTIRCDNPNRPISFNIQAELIINIDSIPVDYNAGKYATSVNAMHSRDEESEEYTNERNDTYRDFVLNIHRVDKEIDIETLLTNAADAHNKTEVMLDDLKALRPIVRGVQVAGPEWADVKLYDVGYVELSKPAATKQNITDYEVDRIGLDSGFPERYIDIDETEEDIVVLTGVLDRSIRNTDREFYGTMRVQVIGRRVDIETGVVEFDLRQRDYSNVYRSVAGG